MRESRENEIVEQEQFQFLIRRYIAKLLMKSLKGWRIYLYEQKLAKQRRFLTRKIFLQTAGRRTLLRLKEHALEQLQRNHAALVYCQNLVRRSFAALRDYRTSQQRWRQLGAVFGMKVELQLLHRHFVAWRQFAQVRETRQLVKRRLYKKASLMFLTRFFRLWKYFFLSRKRSQLSVDSFVLKKRIIQSQRVFEFLKQNWYRQQQRRAARRRSSEYNAFRLLRKSLSAWQTHQVESAGREAKFDLVFKNYVQRLLVRSFQSLRYYVQLHKFKTQIKYQALTVHVRRLKRKVFDALFNYRIQQNKRKYLENNVNYLRQMLQKDQDVHKQENSRIMKENVMLLQEINVLRKDVHELRQKLRLIGIIGGGEMGSTQRSQQHMDMSMRSAEKEHLNDIQKELKL